MNTTYEVRIHEIRTVKGKTRTGYVVRWAVQGKRFGKNFSTKALAESYRSKLLIAQREGTAFDVSTGLPEPMARKLNSRSWLSHAMAFVDMKWPHSSPKHRVSIAEALSTATPAFLTTDRGAPSDKDVRAALYGWAFNKVRRASDTMPDDVRRVLDWIESHCVSVADISDAALIRKALDTIALRIDGEPAAANTVTRKRAVLYGTLQYAVELKLLESHPFTHISWVAPKTDDEVDRRTVVNPTQAITLLGCVAKRSPELEAFFGIMYYSALRPEEALFLHRNEYERPTKDGEWGWLNLTGSTVTLGKDWSGTDSIYQDRALKHRAKTATRRVPAPPELVKLLDVHIERYKVAETGRVFVIQGGMRPGRPISSSTYTRVWRQARQDALSKAQQDSPLAKVPYHLRHAAVSLWLNAGVPATQVAEWAGHSLHVLLKVYAKCIDGQEDAARARIALALGTATAQPHTTPKP
jgi:integrase